MATNGSRREAHQVVAKIRCPKCGGIVGLVSFGGGTKLVDSEVRYIGDRPALLLHECRPLGPAGGHRNFDDHARNQ